ncbi:hypothetical protein ZHAS_00006314 [Anopheles sinensis]|uniref:Uncharacterized protein n=1 Tax=Anopheles sinensis TaxID=74873 RepID=A0A084VLI5_ANOSI|nr:hypothetical protein ZHAS_00006314 [Anopheles sinensis]
MLINGRIENIAPDRKLPKRKVLHVLRGVTEYQPSPPPPPSPSQVGLPPPCCSKVFTVYRGGVRDSRIRCHKSGLLRDVRKRAEREHARRHENPIRCANIRSGHIGTIRRFTCICDKSVTDRD